MSRSPDGGGGGGDRATEGSDVAGAGEEGSEAVAAPDASPTASDPKPE